MLIYLLISEGKTFHGFSDTLSLPPNFISISDEIPVVNDVLPEDEGEHIILYDCHSHDVLPEDEGAHIILYDCHSHDVLPEDEGEHIILYDCHSNDDQNPIHSIHFSERLKDLVLPSWGAYHSALQEMPSSSAEIFMFPLIPGPSQDYSSIYSALKQVQHQCLVHRGFI